MVVLQAIFASLPMMIAGGLLIYFNKPIAHFAEKLEWRMIRGLESSATYTVLGWLLVIGYPLYQIFYSLALSSIK